MFNCYLGDGEFIEIQEKKKQICYYCHEVKEVDYICSNNSSHFFCEDCRLAEPNELIFKVAKRGVTDIIADLNAIMAHPTFDFYSPFHHPLVATLYYSYLCTFNNESIDEGMLQKLIRKAKRYELGSCGRRGVCGAIGGIGIAVARYLHATEETVEERNIVLQIVGKALETVSSLELPRCCKLSTYLSIQIANKILTKRFKLPILDIHCFFAQECELREKCPFGG